MKLDSIQTDFINSLYGKDLPILKAIKGGNIPKEELFDIYRNNIYMTLINALRLTYPMVHAYLGEQKFKDYALKYIENNRSISGNLDDYGHYFLQDSDSAFLKDLATFELLKHKSYLAKDCDAIDIQALQQLDERKLFDIKFKVNPSCFLHSSDYNLLAETNADKLQKRTIRFIIYRQNLQIKTKKISKGEYDFMEGVTTGLTLYEVYEKYPPNTKSCLQKFLACGILCGFSVD